jgi:beta-N-acetylhexosaminidase
VIAAVTTALSALALAGAPPPQAADSLGDAQLIGQRLIAGFDGEAPPASLTKRIRAGRLAGVILFADNFDGRAEARRLIGRLQSIPRPAGLRSPLLIMADQEGGLVKRLPGPPTLSAEQMGEAGPPTCRKQGTATGSMLRRTGVTVDLAPVLDVARSGGAIDREHRAFGDRPAEVTRCGGASAAALARSGVSPTAKHFPGLGAARVNTDDAVQRIGISRRRLRHFDERPYGGFVGSGAARRLVMVSSAVYTAFSDRPAAMTPALATRELRGRLGFDGVSITDALETASTAAFGGPVRAARDAAAAGTDLLLFADVATAAEVAHALRADLRDAGPAGRERFRASARRVLELRRSR